MAASPHISPVPRDGQQLLPIRTVLLVKPCSVFCLSIQTPASVCQCHISWSCHVREEEKKKKKSPLAKKKSTALPQECDVGSRGCSRAFRCYEGKEMETNASEVKGKRVYEAETVHY